MRVIGAIVSGVSALVIAIVAVTLAGTQTSSIQATLCPVRPSHREELGPYRRTATNLVIGPAEGQYGGEFASTDLPAARVVLDVLPDRPYLGTELYYMGTRPDDAQERAWFQELELDFLRVEVTAGEIVSPGQTNSRLPADFTTWPREAFEGGKGWRFNYTESSVTNILENSYGVKFPMMMMMHYGGEAYMGKVPTSQDYADYFLATVYYYNVIRGMNIQYWEVLNEPDWGYTDDEKPVSSDEYARIFRMIVERIKSFPDPRVSGIRLGGPALGSGDPVDGKWPDGYANKTSEGGRNWRSYIPTMLKNGSRPGQCDVGFLSWHDYGSDRWGLPNNVYSLDRIYALGNRVRAFDEMARSYAGNSVGLPLVVSEMNLAAGNTNSQAKNYYKTFYAALWHTSALNNYFATGRMAMISHFYWKGDNSWPKGLVYKSSDSGNRLVRMPVWWAYREYVRHTQDKLLSAQDGRVNPWTDLIVTTDTQGQVFNMIVVNKSDKPQPVDFSFVLPETLQGPVAISRETMVASGGGLYGKSFAEPTIATTYRDQPVTFTQGKQVRYTETIPPGTIIYYTGVRMGAQ